eukprot:gene6444-biopygen14932
MRVLWCSWPGDEGQNTGAGVAWAWRGRGAGYRIVWLGWHGRGAGVARACPVTLATRVSPRHHLHSSPPPHLHAPQAAAVAAREGKKGQALADRCAHFLLCLHWRTREELPVGRSGGGTRTHDCHRSIGRVPDAPDVAPPRYSTASKTTGADGGHEVSFSRFGTARKRTGAGFADFFPRWQKKLRHGLGKL